MSTGDLGGGSGFASGSPNVFQDATGQSARVTIHPDEAVVPLPDGRSVPVVLSGRENLFADLRRQVTEAIREGSATVASGGRRGETEREQGPRFVFNGPLVNVQTPNPDAFRPSKDQVTQQLAAELERVVRRFGKARLVDDPTKRLQE